MIGQGQTSAMSCWFAICRSTGVRRAARARRRVAASGLPMRDALGAPDPDPEAGAGDADVDLYADGDAHAFAAGTFEGHLIVACSRCVEPVRLEIDEQLRVTFMPPARCRPRTTAPARTASRSPTEDLDVFPFDGESIDLEPLLARAVRARRAVRPAVPRGLQRPVPAVRDRPEFGHLQRARSPSTRVSLHSRA